MDIIFIDSSLPQDFADDVVKQVVQIFGTRHKIDICKVSDGKTAWSKLTEAKTVGYVGSFAVVSSRELEADFARWFMNNTIACRDWFDRDRLVRTTAKQIAWMLNNFGRERKDASMTSNIWVVSDTHFWHENIIKYCNRPYANVQEMNEDLIAKWNTKVKENDVVWHLGDFCFGCKEHIIAIVPRLNGRINLVLGNHDHHKIGFYYDAGFHRVYDHPVVISNFFILSHEPLQWVPDNTPMCNIFGHVHQQQLYKTFTPRTVCVCVERWNYTPVRWIDLINGMQQAENDLEAC